MHVGDFQAPSCSTASTARTRVVIAHNSYSPQQSSYSNSSDDSLSDASSDSESSESDDSLRKQVIPSAQKIINEFSEFQNKTFGQKLNENTINLHDDMR